MSPMAGVELDSLFILPGVEPRLCVSVKMLWDPGFWTGLQKDDWVSIPIPCWNNFFSSLDPRNLSTTEFKNEWRYTFTPLCGVHTDYFIYCSCVDRVGKHPVECSNSIRDVDT